LTHFVMGFRSAARQLLCIALPPASMQSNPSYRGNKKFCRVQKNSM
jgi:hypothetical protein